MLSQATLSRDVLEARSKIEHSKSSKAGQLLAIDALINKKKDKIFIAKTGYRKSIVYHSVLALKPDTMTLMIMLLLALEEDQKLAINEMQVAIER